jgi:hypothetical protein
VLRKKLLRDARTGRFWRSAGDVAVRLKRADGSRVRFWMDSVGRAEMERVDRREMRRVVRSILFE